MGDLWDYVKSRWGGPLQGHGPIHSAGDAKGRIDRDADKEKMQAKNSSPSSFSGDDGIGPLVVIGSIAVLVLGAKGYFAARDYFAGNPPPPPPVSPCTAPYTTYALEALCHDPSARTAPKPNGSSVIVTLNGVTAYAEFPVKIYKTCVVPEGAQVNVYKIAGPTSFGQWEKQITAWGRIPGLDNRSDCARPRDNDGLLPLPADSLNMQKPEAETPLPPRRNEQNKNGQPKHKANSNAPGGAQ